MTKRSSNRLEALEPSLFGTNEEGYSVASKMIFSDLVCASPGELEIGSHVAINSKTGRASEGARFRSEAFPISTSFEGKVGIYGDVNGIERSVALSAMLDIGNLGIWRCRGYGSVEIEITGRNRVIAFISYAWESDEHKSWVLALTERLIADDIDVLLDLLSPSFDATEDQGVINQWMENSITTADKIIAILTPTYKYKAENNIGGVGYEYSRLRGEEGLVSRRLKRYLGVLRFGAQEESTPVQLKNTLVFDMSETGGVELSSLVESVKK